MPKLLELPAQKGIIERIAGEILKYACGFPSPIGVGIQNPGGIGEFDRLAEIQWGMQRQRHIVGHPGIVSHRGRRTGESPHSAHTDRRIEGSDHSRKAS